MLIGSDLVGDVHTYHIYPLQIIFDRYGGTYSGGKVTAWNTYPENIPWEIYSSDDICHDFWNHDIENYKYNFGVGNTIQEAIDDLYNKLPSRMVEVEPDHWVRDNNNN